jgi:hypothetical protein
MAGPANAPGPVGTRAPWFYDEAVRVGSFTNLDTILPYNTLPKSDTPSPFKRATSEPGLRYQYEGKSYTIDDYLQHQRVMGLLIIKDGEILVERYQYDRKPTDKWSWCTPQQQKMRELARKP